jgi:selenocysteine lyase/cysteine desulfurase
MRALGLLEDGGGVRIGFVHYHGEEDVERVLASLAGL